MKKLLIIFCILFSPCVFARADILMTEVFYDALGTDEGREWLEIANTGSSGVDLTGWKFFENNVNHALSLSQGAISIPSGGFAVIADSPQKFLLDWPDFAGTLFDSSFSLVNTGETLSLKDASGALIHTLTYDTSLGAAGNGNALALVAGGWIEQFPTPGFANEASESETILPEEETPPDTSDDGLPEDHPGNPDDEEAPAETQDDGISEDALEENVSTTYVVLNEIAWMGVSGNQYGEWLELYNDGDTAVSLAGWKLYKDGTSTLVFTFSKAIPAKGFLVLERTTASHPDPLPDIADEAGAFGNGGFSNLPAGEHLVLVNAEGQVADALDFSDGWPAGDNDSKKTMQRLQGEWITAAPTPGKVNAPDPARSIGGGSSTSEGTAPPFTEELSNNTVVQTRTSDSFSNPHNNAGTLALSFVSREENSYLAITNPTEEFISVSGIVLSAPGRTFAIPEGTVVAPLGTAVISNTKARLASARRAVFSETEIIIE